MTLTANIIVQGFGSASGGGGGGAINSPTLAVADNGNGTGGVATISGATSGTTNTVYVAVWNGQQGSFSFVSAGSRIGNGTVTLALAVGWYWGFVRSSDGTNQADSAVMVQFALTDEIDSVYWDILCAVRDQIVSLALSGSPTVTLRKLAPDQNLGVGSDAPFPVIIVCPEREPTPSGSGTNASDEVVYGVWCIVVDKDNRESTIALNLDQRLYWREIIRRQFINQRLSGVSSVYTCQVEAANVAIKEAWTSNLFVSAQLLRFISRESRGN